MTKKTARSIDISSLEERISYSFSGHENLTRALTHASATKGDDHLSHYERLEFLGDRVLGLCVSHLLFQTFPEAREGELSVRLNALVSGSTCAEVADELGLHQFIHAGGDVRQLQSKRMKSVRADVIESLIAAIYLDGGLAAAESFVRRFWSARLHMAGAANRDSKTALQEWAHANDHGTPVYRVENQEGPDHDPVFDVAVIIKGAKGAQGQGRSKRAAEQQAAQEVLVREGVWTLNADGTVSDEGTT